MIPAATPFETELSHRFGRATKRRACLLLEELDLPVPHKRDYVSGKESLHIFLQNHGLLLRFGEKSRARVSDRVLQPLHSSALSPLADFELLPGVRVGGSTADKVRLKLGLLAQGENFPRCEMVRSNIGQIGNFYQGHCLVIDRCAVMPITRTFNISSNPHSFTSLQQLAPVQSSYFAEARTLLAEAFSFETEKVDDDARERFFAFCQRQAALPDTDADKRLHNSWIMSGINRPRQLAIREAAQEYAARYA